MKMDLTRHVFLNAEAQSAWALWNEKRDTCAKYWTEENSRAVEDADLKMRAAEQRRVAEWRLQYDRMTTDERAEYLLEHR